MVDTLTDGSHYPIERTTLTKTPSASERIWGFDWASIFPVELTGKVSTQQFRIVLIDYEEAKAFSKEHFAVIYQNYGAAGLSREESLRRDQYYSHYGDFFGFYSVSELRLVGMFTGTPIDWNSYYLRNASILPEYQNEGMYQQFLKIFLAQLERHGVKKAEGDIEPAHHAHFHILNKLGFVVVGTNATVSGDR